MNEKETVLSISYSNLCHEVFISKSKASTSASSVFSSDFLKKHEKVDDIKSTKINRGKRLILPLKKENTINEKPAEDIPSITTGSSKQDIFKRELVIKVNNVISSCSSYE